MDKPIKIYENGVLIGEHTYKSYARILTMIEAEKDTEIESIRQQLVYAREALGTTLNANYKERKAIIDKALRLTATL